MTDDQREALREAGMAVIADVVEARDASETQDRGHGFEGCPGCGQPTNHASGERCAECAA